MRCMHPGGSSWSPGEPVRAPQSARKGELVTVLLLMLSLSLLWFLPKSWRHQHIQQYLWLQCVRVTPNKSAAMAGEQQNACYFGGPEWHGCAHACIEHNSCWLLLLLHTHTNPTRPSAHTHLSLAAHGQHSPTWTPVHRANASWDASCIVELAECAVVLAGALCKQESICCVGCYVGA